MTKIRWRGVYQGTRVFVAILCDGHGGSRPRPAGLFFRDCGGAGVEERRAIAGRHAPALRWRDAACTESEALLAAAKVAELLGQYDLSLTDVEIRDAPCEQREYETYRKKRIPLDACIGAICELLRLPCLA